jgi:Family of unknown function (DUF6065)
MKLQIFALTNSPPRIVRAQRARNWMDAFPGRHAYRCLPLAIANAYGWDVLSPYAFRATWTGGTAASDVTFEADGDAPYLGHFVNPNFSRGVVTFHTGYLFRTEPGWHLMATGAINAPKDGIVPLTGLIETDWLPYPFTMNWQFTRPGTVRFEAGEPFCRVFPVRAGALESALPEILDMEQDPELHGQYRAWRERRDEFMAKYREGDAATIKQAWQKFYFDGKYPDGSEPQTPHTSKLEILEPRDLRVKAGKG